jgi:hypothetical protein
MVLSPGTGAPQVLALGRRLREQLHKAQVSCGGQILRVHASFGLASLEVDRASSVEELMKRALQRLETAPSAAAARLAADHAPLKPAILPADVERALQVLERLDAGRLGGVATAEIGRRLAAFLRGAGAAAGR